MSTLITALAPFVALLTHYLVKFSKNKIAQQMAKMLAAKMMAEFKKGTQNVGPVSGSGSSGTSSSGSGGGSPESGTGS